MIVFIFWHCVASCITWLHWEGTVYPSKCMMTGSHIIRNVTLRGGKLRNPICNHQADHPFGTFYLMWSFATEMMHVHDAECPYWNLALAYNINLIRNQANCVWNNAVKDCVLFAVELATPGRFQKICTETRDTPHRFRTYMKFLLAEGLLMDQGEWKVVKYTDSSGTLGTIVFVFGHPEIMFLPQQYSLDQGVWMSCSDRS